jgi:hypothetical protein
VHCSGRDRCEHSHHHDRSKPHRPTLSNVNHDTPRRGILRSLFFDGKLIEINSSGPTIWSKGKIAHGVRLSRQAMQLQSIRGARARRPRHDVASRTACVGRRVRQFARVAPEIVMIFGAGCVFNLQFKIVAEIAHPRENRRIVLKPLAEHSTPGLS